MVFTSPVAAGLDVVVINYRNQRGKLASEVLRFEGEEVVEEHGTYLADALDEAAGAAGAS